MKVQSDPPATYTVEGYTSRTQDEKEEDECIANALCILNSRLKQRPIDVPITGPSSTVHFLRLSLAGVEREIFSVLFLDTRHRLIEFVKLFYGSIDSCNIHPREIVRMAMKLNAAAIILAHNHPSGVADASAADINITERIKSACSFFDIRVLDHIIVGGDDFVSLAATGRM